MKYWLQCLGLAALLALINYYRLQFTAIDQLPVIKQLLIPVVNFTLALILGIRLPDIDLFTPGLKHRCALTHSALVPWLLTVINYPFILAGMAMGMAIHLLADVFPKAWVGGALVKMPLLGSLGIFSPFWLMVNCLFCLAISLQTLVLQEAWSMTLTFALSLLVMLWYFIRKEKSMPPLLTALMIIGVLVWSHYSPDLSWFNLQSMTANASWHQGAS
ncbi:hypothetical protein [Candidatus Sororendozoicomonas aggregata]|uniref:hypothetical protein n=1 Tax=Candidatus Sororendozoicomonas aggregata TaxID=3073239 RepID=UPI002ED220B0